MNITYLHRRDQDHGNSRYLVIIWIFCIDLPVNLSCQVPWQIRGWQREGFDLMLSSDTQWRVWLLHSTHNVAHNWFIVVELFDHCVTEPSPAKTELLRSNVVVIPKEGLAGTNQVLGPAFMLARNVKHDIYLSLIYCATFWIKWFDD